MAETKTGLEQQVYRTLQQLKNRPAPPLTGERARELLDYDARTGILRWRVNRGGKARANSIAGRRTDHGHVQVGIDGRPYYAHRVIFLMVTGAWPKHEVDHVNGIAWDNRWTNLRDATHIQNTHNRRIQRNNKSGYSGVSFHKRSQKWQASIRVNGRDLSLGLHAAPELAAAAYARAAAIHRREFARAA